MKKIFPILTCAALLASCNYLDVVPESKATFDDCFKSQSECQKFEYYLYQSMPLIGTHYTTPDFFGGDDYITGVKGTVAYFQYKSILYGLESPSQSYWGFWWTGSIPEIDWRRNPLDVYESIRHCYMLLNNIDRVPDISEENYNKWRGEAYFLIGYYHNVLFDYYGPCVLIRGQVATDATSEELFQPRATADECEVHLRDVRQGRRTAAAQKDRGGTEFRVRLCGQGAESQNPAYPRKPLVQRQHRDG